MSRVFPLSVLAIVFLFSSTTVSAQTADTLYYAIDMQRDSLVMKSTFGSVVEDLQKVVVLCAVPEGQSFAKLLTLRSSTGEQIGEAISVSFPPSPCHPPEPGFPQNPCKIIFSNYFMRGHVVALTENLGLMFMPVTIGRDGTPVAGDWICGPQLGAPDTFGGGNTIIEMDGSLFSDNLPRLAVTTRTGIILRVIASPLAPEVEAVHYITSGRQFKHDAIFSFAGMPVLVMASGPEILGLSIPDDASEPEILFTLANPGPNDILGFADITSHPPDPGLPTNIVFSESRATALGLAAIPPDVSGNGELGVFDYTYPPNPVVFSFTSLVSGSLLLLAEDSSSVWYDPNFSDSAGFGDCILLVSSNIADQCGLCCDQAGDFDNNFTVDISDMTAMVDFMFGGGLPAPCPAEADLDNNCSIDISDLTYRVDWMFGSGPAPICGCI